MSLTLYYEDYICNTRRIYAMNSVYLCILVDRIAIIFNEFFVLNFSFWFYKFRKPPLLPSVVSPLLFPPKVCDFNQQ